ncbi:MAG: ABC transporter ATP-binding protein [Alphaproteobacteria bacterium]|nr:ABC transporter ATP-binding protein [Alphaproteobacteria bacterium]
MTGPASAAPLLDVAELSIAFRAAGRQVQALDGVSFSVLPGEVVAIVGESGSGKTVAALSTMGLLPPHVARIGGGSIRFEGTEILGAAEAVLGRLRGSRIGMIFQEPMTALNPVLTIGEQVAEPLVLHRGASRKAAREQALALLRLVRLADPGRLLGAYPHQLSGGMRQRVMIAQALACEPSLLIADEPTTALDVTVQAQIMALLRGLQQQLGMAMVLITHDLALVSAFAARIVVMYAGRVVEQGPTARILSAPAHPYTQGLLAATLQLGEGRRERIAEIPGTVRVVSAVEEQCYFHPRCPHAAPACLAGRPPLRPVAAGHKAACIRVGADHG